MFVFDIDGSLSTIDDCLDNYQLHVRNAVTFGEHSTLKSTRFLSVLLTSHMYKFHCAGNFILGF